MRLLLSYLAYPVVLGAAVAATWWSYGVAELEEWMAASLINGAAAVLVFALDRLLPYQPAWARSHGDIKTDLCHIFLGGSVVEGFRLVSFAGLAAASLWLVARLDVALWPNSWPLWVQLPMALVGCELLAYGFHRLSHKVGWLWRLHSVHHSAPRLYLLNAFRIHPIDAILSVAVQVAPLVALGASSQLVGLFVVFAFTHTMLQHSNADLRLGPLNWIVAGPELHRWHHSRRLEEQQSNYGTILILWDVVFGTRQLPSRPPPADVGLGDAMDERYPVGYLGQLLAPFSSRLWRRPPASPSE